MSKKDETELKEPKVPEGSDGAEGAVGADDADNDEELLATRDEVKKKIEAKSKNKEEKTYSSKEVDEMMKKLEKKFSGMRETDDEDFVDLLDQNAKKRKFIRLARLNNKFVIGMKDMNTDSYSDEPIYVTNVENPKKAGEYIPWATFIYDEIDPETGENKTELYPYLAFMNKAVGVWGEVLSEEKVDVSKKFGVIDVKEVDEENEWNLKRSGKKVLAKALQFRTTYIVKDIKHGKDLRISEDVVNKVEAPYSELKKFIDATSQ